MKEPYGKTLVVIQENEEMYRSIGTLDSTPSAEWMRFIFSDAKELNPNSSYAF